MGLETALIMKKALIILSFLVAACGPEAGTFVYEGNPLVRTCYTADPAPMVASDGRLYLFCGHDEQFDNKPGYEGKYGFNITEWLCFSTDDMKNWTDHGVVMKPTDFSWAVGEAWASQCIEANGKFYFYVSCQSGDPDCKAIGVAVADSPTGPYHDAIGRALILDDMTPNGPRGWWNDFDPTVMIDDDGTPWLCWGNGTCFWLPLSRTWWNWPERSGPCPWKTMWKAPGFINAAFFITMFTPPWAQALRRSLMPWLLRLTVPGRLWEN